MSSEEKKQVPASEPVVVPLQQSTNPVEKVSEPAVQTVNSAPVLNQTPLTPTVPVQNNNVAPTLTKLEG